MAPASTARPPHRRIRSAYGELKLILGLLRERASADEQTRSGAGLLLLARAASVLLPGYRVTMYGKSWWEDERFFAKLHEFEPGDWSGDRRFFLAELLKLVEEVPGDTAEAGVFEGASSWFVCDRLAGSGRTHFAFDSFAGLPEGSAVDGSYWKPGDMHASEALVRQRLAPFDAVVERGWIPEVFDVARDRRFSFVHVDVDLYEPTRASIEFFYPRLNPGGILVCDDYGFSICPGATRAVDEFLADKPEAAVHVPTGQGFLIKS